MTCDSGSKSEINVESVGFLRELSTMHDDCEEDGACIANKWAADEIERLRDLLRLVRDRIKFEANSQGGIVDRIDYSLRDKSLEL